MGSWLEDSNSDLSSNPIPASPGNQVRVASSPTGSHHALNKDGGLLLVRTSKASESVPEVVSILGC